MGRSIGDPDGGKIDGGVAMTYIHLWRSRSMHSMRFVN